MIQTHKTLLYVSGILLSRQCFNGGGEGCGFGWVCVCGGGGGGAYKNKFYST